MRQIFHGREFQIWRDRQSWFWMVIDADRGRGAVGGAATQSEAIIEARSSVEAMLLRRDPPRLSAPDWSDRLSHLDRYLAYGCA